MNSKEAMDIKFSPKTALGTHVIYEIYGIEPEKINNILTVEKIIDEITKRANLHVVNKSYHQFGGGGGVSGMHILKESHISIHTWPEFGYAAADVFTCSECDHILVEQSINENFNPKSVEKMTIIRGLKFKGEKNEIEILRTN